MHAWRIAYKPLDNVKLFDFVTYSPDTALRILRMLTNALANLANAIANLANACDCLQNVAKTMRICYSPEILEPVHKLLFLFATPHE
jgi:hypothetical protein